MSKKAKKSDAKRIAWVKREVRKLDEHLEHHNHTLGAIYVVLSDMYDLMRVTKLR